MSDDYEYANDQAVSESEPPHAQLAASEEKKERERARLQLEADIEAFLAGGGKIQEVGASVMADPPKRPESNYGGQPI